MYLDDCIVYASNEVQFVERLREVIQRFKDRGLLLKAKNCRFGMASIEYVGRVVSKDGLSMSAPKIENPAPVQRGHPFKQDCLQDHGRDPQDGHSGGLRPRTCTGVIIF